MQEVWRYQASQPPAPAYTDSVFGGRKIFNPRLESFYFDGAFPTEVADYDYSFQPIIVGGDLLFGSSSEEAVFCIDVATGREKWAFHVNGPVRLTPVCKDNRVYFGSDDGFVYCLDRKDATLVWKARIGPDHSRIVGNGKLISAWPVRGGLTLHNGMVYCSAGMFPAQGVYFAALDMKDGRKLIHRRTPHAASGQSLIVEHKLWIPEHRIAPIAYDLSDGASQEMEKIPVIRAAGGSRTWRVDSLPVYGPSESGYISIRISPETFGKVRVGHGGAAENQFPPGTFTSVAANRMVANDQAVVLLRNDQVRGLKIQDFRDVLKRRAKEIEEADKAGADKHGKLFGGYNIPVRLGAVDKGLAESLNQASAWQKDLRENQRFFQVIATHNAFFLGGMDTVVALDPLSGREIWQGQAEGNVYSLAFADGKLYAGTDRGVIHCFGPAGGDPEVRRTGRTVPARADALGQGIQAFARNTLDRAGRSKGFCVVLGAALEKEAEAIARNAQMSVVLVEADATRADALRKHFRSLGLLGRSVFVRSESDALALPTGMANVLIVAKGASRPAEQYLSVVQPYGGVLLLPEPLDPALAKAFQLRVAEGWDSWNVYLRDVPDGFGQWGSSTGDPGNSMCTGEEVVGDGPLKLQWFGRPYAPRSPDRHYVPQTPLFKDGILYYFDVDHALMGIDAYNGTVLWKVGDVSFRYMASHNPSPACCGDNKDIFAVWQDRCRQIDGVTGQVKKTWRGVTEGYDWGYVGVVDRVLLGSSQGKVVGSIAAHDRTRRTRGIRQVATNFSSMPAVSKDLFAFDVNTGRKLWQYQDGVIVSNSICAGDGKVFFLQSTNKVAHEDRRGLVQLSDFLKQDESGRAELVALDLQTGRVVWKEPFVSPFGRDWLVYLTCVDETLLITHTGYPPTTEKKYHKTYRYVSRSVATGAKNWETIVKSTTTRIRAGLSFAKNTLSARPIVVGERFYLFATLPGNDGGKLATPYDLKTGKQLSEPVEAGTNDKGCSTALASRHAFYYRDWHHAALPLQGDRNYKLTGVTRPSCWPNTLPVGGLILAPEGAAACSCGFQYQISFALAPASK
jgi:outer membrane protein assembly factor BamB